MEYKQCLDCVHEDKDGVEEPCSSCLEGVLEETGEVTPLGCFSCKWSTDDGAPDMGQYKCLGCTRMSEYEPVRYVRYAGPCYAGPVQEQAEDCAGRWTETPPVSEVDLSDTVEKTEPNFRMDRGAPALEPKLDWDIKGTVLAQEEPYTPGGFVNPLAVHDSLCKAGREIMMIKNHDYTGGSGDPYANFRGSTALGIPNIQGILLRVQDKMMRIKTFEEKGELKVAGESIADALIDVINYMVLIGGLVKEMQDAEASKETQESEGNVAVG